MPTVNEVAPDNGSESGDAENVVEKDVVSVMASSLGFEAEADVEVGTGVKVSTPVSD